MRSDEVQWAYFSKEIPPHAKRNIRRRGARAKGVAYERKFQRHFQSSHPVQYLPSPWIRYKLVSGALKWCQPDGLFFNVQAGIITIVEVKLSHTPDAYDQLWNLYHPVLEKIFSPRLWSIRGLEVVRWYDPYVGFPGKHRLRKSIEDVKYDETGVLIWNPRRTRK